MKLYFGNTVTAVTTIMILVMESARIIVGV